MDAPTPSNPNPDPRAEAGPAGQSDANVKVVRGGDIISMLVGGLVYVFVAGCGVLHILAATKIWNPFFWQGQLWTGVFMVAAPTAIMVLTALPYRVRKRMPESVATVGIMALWIAFFWAACGGH